MIPNVDKTKDMVISFHKQPIDISPICIEGIEIERVKSVKLLGIIVTDKITWNENTGLPWMRKIPSISISISMSFLRGYPWISMDIQKPGYPWISMNISKT